MVKLSVEISDFTAPDLEGKLRAAQTLGIHNVEIKDQIDGKRIDLMNGADVERIRNLLIDYNMRVVLLSTGIPADDKDAYKALFQRALALDVEAVKLDRYEADDIGFVHRLADNYLMDLYVENSAEGPLADEAALFEAVRKQGVGVIFNPLEFVKTERHPFFHVYYGSRIKNDIGFLRISDGLYRVHTPTKLGHGCAEIKELASIMLCRSYKGYFSFTPYMPDMDLEAYQETVETFKYMLKHC